MKPWKELLCKAYEVAIQSKDPSTQNGALIVQSATHKDTYDILGRDYNRFPNGILDTRERWENRALKYKYVQHAERTLIETTRRAHQLSHLDGLTMVCPWAACSECAKEIIQSGISRLVVHKEAHDHGIEAEREAIAAGKLDRKIWSEDIETAFNMFREVGIEIIMFQGPVSGQVIKFKGKDFHP